MGTMTTNRKELILITTAWTLIFASAPLYMCYALLAIHATIDWYEVLSTWSYIAAFLVLFLLNHYILVPKLIGRKLIWQYGVAIVVALALFVVFMKIIRPIHLPEDVAKNITPMLLAPPDMARLVIALLMLGVDMGVVAWTNEQKMHQRLLLLEQQTLKQELQHLHYQINPHFFMNTLNNIHVLVDIDQERAKRSIVELSGLMRYALYEGNGNMVPLSHEVEFIGLYISLMKLRYPEKVEVTCEMPENAPSEVMMPPMLLATFVENAFKHGISYQEHSYIRVKLHIDETSKSIMFECTNSKHANASSTQDGHHGIGLENVKKRLDLQYAESYALEIDDQKEDIYVVRLTLPTRTNA